ncbi:MAG: type I-G CRISPR-associated protein Cas8g1/Csx17, partial [Actinomycetota bacterium]
TPMAAPWNRRSGFRPDDHREKSGGVLRRFESLADPRLARFREAIAAGRRVYEQAPAGWNEKSGKRAWIEACRASFPDEAVEWLDAVAVLTDAGPAYPPVLGGAGGVLGSMDLSCNFMLHVTKALCLENSKQSDRARSLAWLRFALFADPPAPSIKAAVGQFDPGGAGGANSAPMGSGESLVNPWDFMLWMEGALLFAGASARRLSHGAVGKAAMPFTMNASPVGYTTGVQAETSNGELWAPLWRRPATASEVAHLIGEGRSEWRGRQARTGIDMARALATLGVARGIESFVRHVFVQRLGQSTIAVPVGRIEVGTKKEVPLLAQLDPWIERAQRGHEPPAAVASALRRIDATLFDLACNGGAQRLLEVLRAVARAEAAVGRATGFRERSGLRPIQGLAAESWLPHLDDGTPEFRVAAALASLRDREGSCLRFLLRPVHPGKGRSVEWADGPAPVPGFGVRPLDEVLAAAHARRVIDVLQEGSQGGQPGESPAVHAAFRWRVPAPMPDVAAFVHSELEDDRIGWMLACLMLLDWRSRPNVDHWFTPREAAPLPPPPAWALLAPFFMQHPRFSPEELRPEADWPARLARQQVEQVLDEALGRLRMARLDPAPDRGADLARSAPTGVRLGAALLIPVSGAAQASLLRRVVPPSLQETNEEEA